MKKALIGILAVMMVLSLVSCATSASAGSAPLSYDEKYPGKIYNRTQAVRYNSLAEAVEAAMDGDYLIMCKDEVIESQIQIKVPLTLDMNGHYIENISSGCALFVRQGSAVIEGTVTVKNGTIKGKPTGNGTSSLFGFVDVDKAVLEDLTVISNIPEDQTTAAAGLYFNGVRNAQVNNCTVTGKVIAYQRKANGTSVNVTINGGKFVKDPNAKEDNILRTAGDDGSATGSVVINDATFIGTIEDGNYAKITIASGVWATDVTAYVPETSTVAQDGITWTVTKK